MRSRPVTKPYNQYFCRECENIFAEDGPMETEVIDINASEAFWSSDYLDTDELAYRTIYQCHDDPPCTFVNDPMVSDNIELIPAGTEMFMCGECGEIFVDEEDAMECCDE